MGIYQPEKLTDAPTEGNCSHTAILYTVFPLFTNPCTIMYIIFLFCSVLWCLVETNILLVCVQTWERTEEDATSLTDTHTTQQTAACQRERQIFCLYFIAAAYLSGYEERPMPSPHKVGENQSIGKKACDMEATEISMCDRLKRITALIKIS